MGTEIRESGGGTNGIWGSIFSELGKGVAEGVGTITGKVLPVWVANELNVQMADQTRDDTFIPAYARDRIDQVAGGGVTPVDLNASLKWDVNDFVLIGGAILGVMGVAVIIFKL